MLFGEPGPCDRQCLIGVADDYLAALVAHDPDAVPLARDVRFVENSEMRPVGEGLWATASAVPASFAIHVPDPVSEQLGFIGIMEESGQPIQLGLRLKIDNGEITEAEHLVVRNLRDSSLENLKTPRPGLLETVPRNRRLKRELMLMLGMTYYDWIADEVTGLVFGLSQFRQSMKDKEIEVYDPDGKLTTREVNFEPFDLPAAYIFKIYDGKIREIEAMGFMRPYLSTNGWSDFLH